VPALLLERRRGRPAGPRSLAGRGRRIDFELIATTQIWRPRRLAGGSASNVDFPRSPTLGPLVFNTSPARCLISVDFAGAWASRPEDRAAGESRDRQRPRGAPLVPPGAGLAPMLESW